VPPWQVPAQQSEGALQAPPGPWQAAVQAPFTQEPEQQGWVASQAVGAVTQVGPGGAVPPPSPDDDDLQPWVNRIAAASGTARSRRRMGPSGAGARPAAPLGTSMTPFP